MSNSRRAIETACRLVGSQAQLARLIGVKPPTVNQWLQGIRPVPATQCAGIENATGGVVTRYELRPDVFGERAA